RAPGRAHVLAPVPGRPALARGRVRPAKRDVPAPAAAVLRVLRPPPDRPADVAGDGRPAVGAVLPRLRPDLLLPEPDHGRGGRGRAGGDRLAIGAEIGRAHV